MSELLVLLLGLPAGTALLLLLSPRRTADHYGAATGVVASSVTFGVALLTLVARPWQGSAPALELDLPWIPTLGVRLHFAMDGISLPLVLLTAGLGVAVCVHAAVQPPPGGSPRSLVAALLAVQAGATATFLAADMILFFIAFEVVLVPMWAIIRWWGDPHDEVARRDAATRFILFTALGSAIMLLGLLVVALAAGSTDLHALTAARGAGMDRPLQVLAAALLVVGLAVKVPVWPLHTWLPPAHTTAPTVGSVLLAGVLLKMGTYGLVRIALPVVPQGFAVVAPYLAACGVVGILWGALVCLVERDLKRLVAYSSVAHLGFVALGIASGTAQGVQGALFANIAHGVISALLFLVAGALKDRAGSGRMDRIGGGLRDRSPRLGGLLAFGCIAGLGLPGLAGFWGEVLAVLGAWRAVGAGRVAGADGLWRCLAVLAVIGTALAAAYLLRVLRLLWHGGPAASRPVPGDAVPGDASVVEWWLGVPLVAVVLTLGLVPGLLLRLTEQPVSGLLSALLGVV